MSQPIAPESMLVIARTGGTPNRRRQRRFPTVEAAERAVTRWAKEGFATFWTRKGDGALSAPFEPVEGQRVDLG